ncbi:hypothetical protein CAOG_02154 [Capsaspora owczarzaki ATCC 30864]|uniref:G-protein coupled receptors family 3 profile domain-containing protein n=1 Tax=Capsaspora owczarzaki (strain ATCC 30864) TaxID=595528 RepID=A0A0D2U6Y8_CAPO3|nr:hypothetical protein CAOG_02154 [Capsaspora owczarzaki ATCC 30864]KJE90926.1 hypothetical protein CAOG_002154 [Capsaspora owczarzaki ATCC 30864]|eukprot:XP_004348904.2 hypothetical protein CAOG_02154 [Capsaspora owczarzaki ATCC 30864]
MSRFPILPASVLAVVVVGLLTSFATAAIDPAPDNLTGPCYALMGNWINGSAPINPFKPTTCTGGFYTQGSAKYNFRWYCQATANPNVFLVDLVYTPAPTGGSANSTVTNKRSYGTATITNNGDPLGTDILTLVFAYAGYSGRPDETTAAVPGFFTVVSWTRYARLQPREIDVITQVCSGSQVVTFQPGLYSLGWDIITANAASTTMVFQAAPSSTGPEDTMFEINQGLTTSLVTLNTNYNYTFNGIGFRNAGLGLFMTAANAILTLNNILVVNSTATATVMPKSGVSGVSCQVYIRNSRFINNQVNTDFGVVYVKNTQYLEITDSVFINNAAGRSGGCVALADDATALIARTTFTGCSAGSPTTTGIGGVFYGTSADSVLTVRDCVISNSIASTAGVMSFGGTVVFDNNTVTNSQSYRTAGCFALSGQFSISNSTFQGGSSQSSAGFLSITGAGYGTVSNCLISNFSSLWAGGVFNLESTTSTNPLTLDISNTSISNCYGSSGGVFALSYDRQVRCTQCTLSGNSAESGGVVQALDNAIVTFVNSTFSDNAALSGGIFHGSNYAYIGVYSSVVTNASVVDHGGAVLLTSDSTFYAEHSVFDSCTAVEIGGFAAVSDLSSMTLINSVVRNCVSRDSGGAIAVTAESSLTITSSTFENNRAFGDGGAIRATGTSTIVIANSTFNDMDAQRGGAVFLGGYAQLTVSGSTFSNNTAALIGGGIAMLDLSEARISNSSFESNLASPVADTPDDVTGLSVSSFTNSAADATGGGAVALTHISSLTCDQCIFFDNAAYAGYGGSVLVSSSLSSSRAVYIAATDAETHSIPTFLSANISSSIISFSAATLDGGGIAVRGGHVTLTDTTVSYNKAGRNGGGISYIVRENEPSQLRLIGSVVLFNNTASGFGGGAHFDQLVASATTVEISAEAQLTSNQASSGGAFYLASLDAFAPIWLSGDANSQLANNTATVYGAVSASPPVLVVPHGAALPSTLNLQRGGILPTASFALLDTFESVVAISDGVVEFSLQDSHGNPVPVSVAHIGGVSRRPILGGIASFMDVPVFAVPGNYTLVARFVPSSSSTIDPSSVAPATSSLLVQECSGDDMMLYNSAGEGTCYASFERSDALRYVILAIAVLGALSCVLLLLFIVANREAPQMKASSPRFMCIIIGGCIIAFILVATLVPNVTDTTCTVHIWFGHIAFTVTFGALFFKSYRIAVIFNNRKLKRQLSRTSDRFLLTMVSLIVGGMVTYLIIWTAVDRPVRDFHIVGSEVRVLCSSSSTLWVVAVYIAEALLLAFGAIVAFKSRRAPSRWNESKFLAFAIWNIFVVVVIVMPLNYLVDTSNPDTQFLLTCIGVLLAAFGTLGLCIVPKVHSVVSKAEVAESSADRKHDSSSTAVEMTQARSKLQVSKLEGDLQLNKVQLEESLRLNEALDQRNKDLEARVTGLLMDLAQARRSAALDNTQSSAALISKE